MKTGSTTIHGFCDSRFETVREAFQRNFDERGEIGAAVSICLDGKPLVDLWGGIADQESGRPWDDHTTANIFSCTKGVSAICLHMLADRGLLDFEAPVARYWPEFAAAGKEAITVAMVMSHQAGLPVWMDPVPEGAMLEWDLATRMLAEQAPIWEPGTAHGYHALSLGYLEGEIFRRIAGCTIGQFLAGEVAGPLGAEMWIGLPEEEEANVATSYFDPPNADSPAFQKMMQNPDWFVWKLFDNAGGDGTPESVNSRARRAAEIPAAGGIATARGLARVYSPLSLDGSVDNIRIVKASGLSRMATIRSASDVDLVLQIPTTFTLGFSNCWGARRLGEGEQVIIGERAFGTPGMGGSIGFADPQAGMSFAYVMNRHGAGVGLNGRGQSLVDAAYSALGFHESASGAWAQ